MTSSSDATPLICTRTATKRGVWAWLWIIPVILCIFGGFLYARSMIVARNRPSPLQVNASQLDLGVVWSQQELKWPLKVENVGSGALSVVNVESTCTCTSITPRQFTLQPGEIITLDLTLNLTSRRDADAKSSARTFEVSLTPLLSDKLLVPVDRWTLRGQVRNAFHAKPRKLAWDGEHELVNDTPHPAQFIDVTANYPLREVTAEVVPPVATVALTKNLNDWQAFRATITPNSGLTLGQFEAQLRLIPELPSGERLPVVTMPLTGVVVRDISAMPESIQFGTVPAGARLAQKIVFKSLRGQPFAVSLRGHSQSGVTVTPVRKISDEAFEFIIELTSALAGPQSNSIRFCILPQGAKEYDVEIKLSYQGC